MFWQLGCAWHSPTTLPSMCYNCKWCLARDRPIVQGRISWCRGVSDSLGHSQSLWREIHRNRGEISSFPNSSGLAKLTSVIEHDLCKCCLILLMVDFLVASVSNLFLEERTISRAVCLQVAPTPRRSTAGKSTNPLCNFGSEARKSTELECCQGCPCICTWVAHSDDLSDVDTFWGDWYDIIGNVLQITLLMTMRVQYKRFARSVCNVGSGGEEPYWSDLDIFSLASSVAVTCSVVPAWCPKMLAFVCDICMHVM